MPSKTNTTVESMRNRAQEMGEDVKKVGRDAWLVGLGFVATAEEQARDVFDRLKAKGESLENREDSKIAEAFDKTTAQFKDLGKRVEEGVQTGVATVLHRVGVPSQKEISTLIDRVEKLTKKVDALRA